MPRFWPFCLAATLTIIVISCGGSSSPTAPSSSYITPHNLQQEGGSDWGSFCTSIGGCRFGTSIKNTGAGCASSTAVTVQFYDETGAAYGSAYQMGATGGSLASRTIRPQEVVAISTINTFRSGLINYYKTYELSISANSVNC